MISRLVGLEGGCKFGSVVLFRQHRLKKIKTHLHGHVENPLCDFNFMYACSMIPKSGLDENSSVHSCIRSRTFAFTCWWVFYGLIISVLPFLSFIRLPPRYALTRSFARRKRASVKLLDASSRWIRGPQFCASALAS